MPYVQRDSSGRIIALFNQAQPGAGESLAPDAPEVVDFLVGKEGSSQGRLLASDLAMARVTEDIIDLMMEKNILLFTDLPEAAQRKLLERRTLRSTLGSVGNILVNGDPF